VKFLPRIRELKKKKTAKANIDIGGKAGRKRSTHNEEGEHIGR
jgi:hypothetical protein